MDQRQIRRVIIAAALVMALAPQVHAAGRRIEPGLACKAWHWLVEIWPWNGGSQGAPAARQDPQAGSKRSLGIDPMGAQIASPPSLSDGGKSTDPNG